MEKQAKYELMQKITRELEDLKNSQTAVIKKIAQIEAHNINLSDSDLDSLLSDIHEGVATNLERVETVFKDFEAKTTKYADDNKLLETEATA